MRRKEDADSASYKKMTRGQSKWRHKKESLRFGFAQRQWKKSRRYIKRITAEAARTEGYLPAVVISAMQGSLGRYEDRTARLLFKMAVELSMLLHTVAATNEIEEESLSRLRGMCVQEVKSLKGSITLEEATDFQRGDTDG